MRPSPGCDSPRIERPAGRAGAEYRARGGRPPRRRAAAREPRALRWLGKRRRPDRDFTYATLRDAAHHRFANVLQRASGSARATASSRCAGRIPELYVAALGTLKHRSVFCPLFSAFGPEPIRAAPGVGERQGAGDHADPLPAQGRRHPRAAARARARPAGRGRRPTDVPGTLDLHALTGRVAERRLRDPADRPRGHGAAALHQRHHRARRRARSTSTRRSSPTTRPASSRSTCTRTTSSGARPIPGWVTGTSYGIIAPLTHGVTSIVDEAEFDAERWYRILAASSG